MNNSHNIFVLSLLSHFIAMLYASGAPPKYVGNLSDKPFETLKNGHLEIFDRPQVIENSKQYLLLRTDILQRKVVRCPWSFQHG